jgi:hypothetical protein
MWDERTMKNFSGKTYGKQLLVKLGYMHEHSKPYLIQSSWRGKRSGLSDNQD